MFRCSRGSNNAFSTNDELELDDHFQIFSGPYRFVESGRRRQSSVFLGVDVVHNSDMLRCRHPFWWCSVHRIHIK